MTRHPLVAAIALALGTGTSQYAHAANDIDIVTGSTQTNIDAGSGQSFTSTDDTAALGTMAVESLWTGGIADTVSIATGTGGANTQAGDLSLSGALDFNSASFSDLYLNLSAHDDILLNASIADSDAASNHLNLVLTPDSDALAGGAVYLNSALGGGLSTTVYGTLNIGATGSYVLANASDALIAGSIVNSGSLSFSGGRLALTNDGLLVATGGLLGNAVDIADGMTLETPSLTLGASAMDAGLVTQTGGANAVAGALTIDDGSSYTQSGGTNTVGGTLLINTGGSYALNGGSLAAANTVNSGTMAVTGQFTVAAGESYNLAGGTLSAGSMNTNGTLIQTSGAASVTGALNIVAGGSYDYTGGTLKVGSLTVADGGVLSGTGTVESVGDITDQRVSGNIGVSYSGENITLQSAVMDGSVTARRSLALHGTTVNGAVNGTAMTLSDGAALTGAVDLRPYVSGNVENRSVITNLNGASEISGAVSITPAQVNRGLGIETIDTASIDINGGSLAFTGAIDAAQMHLSANVALGSSLTLGDTATATFTAVGQGEYGVQGLLTAGSATTPGAIGVEAAGFTLSGAQGAIDAHGGTLTIGKQQGPSSVQFMVDNSVAANSNRIGDTTGITLTAGSTLTLQGHATDAVSEHAGALTIRQPTPLPYVFTAPQREFVSNLVVNGAGAQTALTFSALNFANANVSADLCMIAPCSAYGPSTNRVDFATNGTFGGQERIYFTAAPTLTDGLIGNASINGREFASYDNALGLKAATTKNDFGGAGAADNLFVNANTTLVSGATVNSLALAANINGAGTITVNSGRMLMSGVTNVAPAIAFGAREGNLLVLGDSTLAGGVTGAGGLLLNGGGRLALGGAGSISGNAIVNSGELVLSANDALQGADARIYDRLDIGSTTQHLNSLGVSRYGALSGTGTIVATGLIKDARDQFTLDASYVSTGGNIVIGGDGYSANRVVNGDVVAAGQATLTRVTMNGDMSAATVYLNSSVVNGVISGTGGLYGGGTLTNQNTFTGVTNGYFTLRDNGSIVGSSSIIGNIMLSSDDNDGPVDRIGNDAGIAFTQTGHGLTLVGSGTTASIAEDVGAITVASGAEARIAVANTLGGSSLLTANALNMGADSLLFVSLGNASQLKFDSAPTFVNGTSVLDKIYIDKDIAGAIMPTWATYDAGQGVQEIAVAESSIAAAGPMDFIRVTDATNQALNMNHVVGGLNIDTTQAILGTGTLSIASGQLLLWKDNTISLTGLDFGAQQGVIANAGTNTINGHIYGSNGLRKLGDGKLILRNMNGYSGETRVSGGELEIQNATIGAVRVDNGAVFTITNASIGNLGVNDGTVNVNTNFNNLSTNTISGYGVININGGGRLYNQGRIEQTVINSASGGFNEGYISTFNNALDGQFSNYNNIASVMNDGVFNNRYSDYDHVSTKYYRGYISGVTNTGQFTNSGTVAGQVTNSGTFVNTSTGSLNGHIINSGTFTNQGAITRQQQQMFIVDGTGAFINDVDGTVSFANGARATVNGGFINKGAVTIAAGAVVDGAGTYVQQGDAGATTVINGRMETNVDIQTGVLSGTGFITGDLVIGPNGELKPGNSPGLLSIGGNFTLASGGVLNLEVTRGANGALLFDQLSIGGATNLFGQVRFDLGAGVDADIFMPSNSGSSAELSLGNIFLNDLNNSLDLAVLLGVDIGLKNAAGEIFRMTLADDGNGGYTSSVSAVPVPAAVWLFGSGLAALVGAGRRRRTAA